MISSLAWVPAGVADPNPKRYEMSRAEQELIQMMQEKGHVDDEPAVAQQHEEAAKVVVDSSSSSSSSPKSSTLPPAQGASNDLPADLRMDEYSSEEEDEHKDGVAIGQLLVGSTSEAAEFLGEQEQGMDDEDDNDDDDDDDDDNSEANKREDQTPKQPKDAYNHHPSDDEDEDDDDSDDDLADIPDTREYEDVDVEGLQAMGLANVGMSGGGGMMMLEDEDDDDDSEAEDVRITADDALIAVAKTEEVSGAG